VVTVDVVEWRCESPLPDQGDGDGVTVGRLSRARPELREVLPRRLARNARGFLARGDEGYVATVGGRFAGWLWLSRVSHRDPWSGLRFRIAPDEAYSYAMWAEPEHRHLGVGAKLMASLLADAKDDPALTRVYGWVDADNREMQVLIRMVFGFTDVQQVRRARVLHLFGVQVPASDRPRFGPVSRAGRHSGGARS